MNEHGLRNATSTYLKTLAPAVLFEKRWGGAFFQRKGVSDYTGLGWGLPFAIELKHPDEPCVATEAQALYLRAVADAGGYTLLANNLQAIKDFMARLYADALRLGVWKNSS